MKFLLDTNVVSEPLKPQPSPNVLQWLANMDEDQTFISVVTLAEIRTGIDRMAIGAKRKRLEEWLSEELRSRFEGRVLSVGPAIADVCGRVVAHCHDKGHPIGAMDAFIAATAEVHNLTLVTRDVADFQLALQSILNPWVVQ